MGPSVHIIGLSALLMGPSGLFIGTPIASYWTPNGS